MDIVNAFFSTLYHEVPLADMQSVERKKALCNFLKAVDTTLPGMKADKLLVFLHPVCDSSGKQMMNIEDWKKAVVSAGIPIRGTPDALQWRTCKGSSWRYRGFTCGLWLLYHSMVVPARPEDKVLDAIVQYVSNFFTCADCRNHFKALKIVEGPNPVLQLWGAHNAVSRRLAKGNAGNDPMVPKRLFPDRTLCATCFSPKSFKANVLYRLPVLERYLRSRYRWNPAALLRQGQ